MLYRRSVVDKVSVSDTVGWSKKRGIEGVIEEIKDAQSGGNYYTAISLACSYVQYFGKKVLGYQLDDRVDLNIIIKKLSNRKIVDKAICDDIDKVARLGRNGLQHNGLAFEYSSKVADELNTLTGSALKCLEALKI
jgi:hypothetical protein